MIPYRSPHLLPDNLRIRMAHLCTGIEAESLRNLQWWAEHTVDETNGGFIGRIDGNGVKYPSADKGVILHTRILWTFAEASRVWPGKGPWIALADRAFAYLNTFFLDHEAGGLFWMLDFQGNPVQDKKQVYAQAFGMYAYAAYHRATGNPVALEYALQLFDLIESKSLDRERGGYLEAMDRYWGPLADLRLSEKDAQAAKTMNTHLHLLEAYTHLFRIAPSARLHDALERLILLFLKKFILKNEGHLQLFFNENWQKIGDITSFGHDIEAAWLLTEAAEVLGDSLLLEQTCSAALMLAEAVLKKGKDLDGGLFNEAEGENLKDIHKDWWPQAEAVVGFINAWQISGEQRFAAAALSSWDFIRHFIADYSGGEWFWAVDETGRPDRTHDKAGPWKCPYHNSRAGMEVLRRLSGNF